MPAGKSSLPQKDKILGISPQQDIIASLLTLKKKYYSSVKSKDFYMKLKVRFVVVSSTSTIINHR